MASNAEQLPKELFTPSGARLTTLRAGIFDKDYTRALTPTEINEGQIYEARSTSSELRFYDRAVSFDVMIDRKHPISGSLSTVGFRLLLLDDDFQQLTPPHTTEMYRDTWRVTSRNAAINARTALTAQSISLLRSGYLLQHPDRTTDSLASATRLLRNRGERPLS